MPQLAMELDTQACALMGNLTGDLLLCRTMPNPLSHIGQGNPCISHVLIIVKMYPEAPGTYLVLALWLSIYIDVYDMPRIDVLVYWYIRIPTVKVWKNFFRYLDKGVTSP